ncbi:hypothetical protein B0H13DRAFT_2310658 [Mycena leptocephala]|nr:hypothetical protein B0H13DRAFT_2310658 [Mycena leptocephala]
MQDTSPKSLRLPSTPSNFAMVPATTSRPTAPKRKRADSAGGRTESTSGSATDNEGIRERDKSIALAENPVLSDTRPFRVRSSHILPCTPPGKRFHAATPSDSPDNPFLSSPLDPDQDALAEDPLPKAEEEKPTTTLVFRGVRLICSNPHYNVAESPRSRLPPEHPDFEPDERSVRKLLFGGRRKSAVVQNIASRGRVVVSRKD